MECIGNVSLEIRVFKSLFTAKKLAFTVRKTKVKFTQNAGLLTLTRVLHTENPTFFVEIIECINCGHIYDDHVAI